MNTCVGILGGGQLAMLMCEEARELGLRTVVLCPESRAPAARSCDEYICAEYTDTEALDRMAASCQVITLDNEHLPDETLMHLGAQVSLHPSATMMRRLRDRLAQRGFLERLGAPQPRFFSVDKPAAVAVAERSAPFPGFLKRRRGGYDGKGQMRVARGADLAAAWEELGRAPCVLEEAIDFELEFSLVGARGAGDALRLYPPIRNDHVDGQLYRSRWPAGLPEAAHARAEEVWHAIAEAWPSRGVIAVEFFLARDGRVLVNEIAPRVHNSGHLTQFGANCSQFALHMRAVVGMPLPELQTRDAAMLNLYPQHEVRGDRRVRQLEEQAGGRIITYGKTPRPRRKMGHWLLEPDALEKAERLLGPAPNNEDAQAPTPA